MLQLFLNNGLIDIWDFWQFDVGKAFELRPYPEGIHFSSMIKTTPRHIVLFLKRLNDFITSYPSMRRMFLTFLMKAKFLIPEVWENQRFQINPDSSSFFNTDLSIDFGFVCLWFFNAALKKWV